MISSVTLRFLYALVSHLCLTELPEVTMPYSDMWQDCQITFPYTRPCYAKSSYRLVDPQTLHGNVHQVDHVPDGPTNSAAITAMFPLRLCGGKLLVAVTRERRYGPSRLRINDDDDAFIHWNHRWLVAQPGGLTLCFTLHLALHFSTPLQVQKFNLLRST